MDLVEHPLIAYNPLLYKDRHGIIHLNLSHNNFTAAGVYSLVQGLINRPSVHSLKITGAKVGDEVNH